MKAIKKLVFVLVIIAALHAPWRLAALAVETFVLSPGPLRTTVANDHYWQALELESRLTQLGWYVGTKKRLQFHGEAAFGLTIRDEHVIYVDRDLSWNDRFATLAHEGGHTLQPEWLDYSQGEAFAESVAMLVAHDGIREHARYLSRARWENLMLIVAEWPAIYHAAAVLEDR